MEDDKTPLERRLLKVETAQENSLCLFTQFRFHYSIRKEIGAPNINRYTFKYTYVHLHIYIHRYTKTLTITKNTWPKNEERKLDRKNLNYIPLGKFTCKSLLDYHN